MPTARELLVEGERRLSQAGVPSPRVDAELLLTHLTGRVRALVRGSGEVTDDQALAYTALVERRAERVPLQHLTGTAAFRYLQLAVGPGVFVPRPETELLVDAVLRGVRSQDGGPDPTVALQASAAPGPPAHSQDDAGPAGAGAGRRAAGGWPPHPAEPGGRAGRPDRSGTGPILVDLCTGSGALALALATELPGSAVHAVELDPRAGQWAARNVSEHAEEVAAAGSALELHLADATRAAEPGGPLAHLAAQVLVVVSNPPYIPDAAIPRDPEVRDHDPARALFGGPDGLDVVRALVGQAAILLRPGGLLVLEHADVQGESAGDAGVPGVLRASGGWRDIADHPDLAGLPRFTTARRVGAAPAGAGAAR